MTEQPRALRLADGFRDHANDPMWADHCEISKLMARATEEELRRIHDMNQRLIQENIKLWGWLRNQEQKRRIG